MTPNYLIRQMMPPPPGLSQVPLFMDHAVFIPETPHSSPAIDTSLCNELNYVAIDCDSEMKVDAFDDDPCFGDDSFETSGSSQASDLWIFPGAKKSKNAEKDYFNGDYCSPDG